MFSETFPVSNILRAMLVFAFPPFPPFLSISIHFLLFCSMLGSFGPGDCDILRLLGTAFQAHAISFPVLRFYCSYCSTSCTCYTCRLKIPDVYSSRQPKACWKHLEASGSCDLSMLKGCSSSGTPSFLLPEILQEGASAGAVPFLRESHELSV